MKKKLDRGELVFIMGDYRALSSKVRPLSFLGYDINPGIENYILTCPERWSLWVDYHLMLSQDLRKHVAESNTVTSTV